MSRTIEGAESDPIRAPLARRWGVLAAASAWVLMVFLGLLQYFVSHQRVVVRWQPSITTVERIRLEQRFALIDGEGASDGAWNYRLRDRSNANLRALVEHRFIAGTGHIDRARWRVELDRPGWPAWVVALAESERLTAATLVVVFIALTSTWPYRRQLLANIRHPSPAASRIGALAVDAGFVILIVMNGVERLIGAYVISRPRLESWQVTELLINYAGGPVRRGLLGEVLRLYNARVHHVDVSLLLFWISLTAWLLSCAMLWRRSRHADLLTRVVILFSPLLLAFPLNDADGFGRKDSLSLIYVSCALLTLAMKERPGRVAMMILAAIGLPLLVATHEAALVFCVPSTLLVYLAHVLRRETPSIGIMVRLCALLAPTLGVLAFVATHGGTPEQALKICLAAAQQYPGLTCAPPPHAMASVTPETQAAFANVISKAWDVPLLYWSLAGTLAYVACLFMAARTALAHQLGPASAVRALDALGVGAFVLLPTIPLYFVGADYGRWLSLSSVIAVLVLTDPRVMTSAAAWIRAVSGAVESNDGNIVPAVGQPAVVRVLMLTTALATPFLFLPHYPPSFLLLRTISDRTLGLRDLSAFVSRFMS
jgi:hypothetical protein